MRVKASAPLDGRSSVRNLRGALAYEETMNRSFAYAALVVFASCADAPSSPVLVRVRVENISPPDAIATSTGPLAVDLPPGVWVVTRDDAPLFTESEVDRGQGLEALAEDGAPSGLVGALAAEGYEAGTFELRDVTYVSGAIAPGEAFVFDVYATPGDMLHIATMLGESNDMFYATESGGIALFEGGTVRTADVTEQIALFALGTEMDEPLGEGPNQPARQVTAGAGASEDGIVTRVTSGAPQPATVLRITIAPGPMASP